MPIGVNVSTSNASYIHDEMDRAFDKLSSGGYITGHKITTWNSNFDRSAYSSLSAIQAANEWLTNNGYDNVGFNLCLHNGEANNPGAGTTSGSAAGLAFTQYAYGQLPCDLKSSSYEANHAIHEAFHQFIDHRLQSVQGRAPDGEHQLGKVYNDSTIDGVYEESPLGDPGTSDEGTCTGVTSVNAYTYRPTNCTKMSISDTHSDAFS